MSESTQSDVRCKNIYPLLPRSNLHEEISSDESTDELHITEECEVKSNGGRFNVLWRKIISWRGRGSGRRENESRKRKEESGILELLGAHFTNVLGVLIVIVAILTFIFFYHFYQTKTYLYNDPTKTYLYNEEFAKMKAFISLQRELSWKTINVTLFRHVFSSEEPLKPAVLNLFGNNDKVKQLLSSISTVLTRSGISGQCGSLRDLPNKSTDDMKKYIKKFILSTIKNGSKCVHIPDLNIIPPSLGPYLHGLTDETSAKIKDIIYIFSLNTMYTPKRHTENVEKDVINVLEAAWLEEMGPERFGALMVRLAINVVLVE